MRGRRSCKDIYEVMIHKWLKVVYRMSGGGANEFNPVCRLSYAANNESPAEEHVYVALR